MTTDNFSFYLKSRPSQTSQTGGQQYSDTSPFSIPWPEPIQVEHLTVSYSVGLAPFITHKH
jgi:hypothetical protein